MLFLKKVHLASSGTDGPSVMDLDGLDLDSVKNVNFEMHVYQGQRMTKNVLSRPNEKQMCTRTCTNLK